MPPQQQTPYVTYNTGQVSPGNNPRRKLLFVIVGVVALVTIILALFLGGSKKITVNVKSDRSSEITYRFVNQQNHNDVKEIKDTAKQVQVSLPKGTYELTVQQDETNHFSVVDTGRDTVVEAAPEPERGRRYVGNIPKECRFFSDGRLYSYDCDGTLDSMQTHVPATATKSTSIRPASTLTEDVIEGLAKTKEGDVLLIYEALVAGHEDFSGHEKEESPHVSFLLKNGLGTNLGTRTALKGLPADERYSIQPYRDGFIAYSQSFIKAFYYRSVSADPQTLTVVRPDKEELVPYVFTAKDSLFAIAYGEEGSSPETASAVVVHEDNQARTYEFDKSFDSVHLCGDKKLCGLSAGTLEVYDVSGDKATLLFSVMGVRGIETYDGGLIVSRDQEVLSLDVDKKTGHVQYTFGEFTPCGITSAGSSYLICIEQEKDNTSMLYIEQDQPSDDIDKKVASLLNASELNVVSVYGSFVAITPGAGGIKYQPATDTFGYDPEKVRASKEAIEKKLDAIGLNRDKYKVRYTIN